MRLNRHAWSAGAAEAAELGTFRHGHRRRTEVSERAVGWIFGPILLAGIFLGLNGQWLVILIIVVVAVLALLGYLNLPFFAPSYPGTPTDPSRIDVYAQGLVLDAGRGGVPVVRWEQFTAAKREVVSRDPLQSVYRISYDVPDVGPAQFNVDKLTSESALLQSIARRTAVPVNYWPRAVGAGLAAAAIGVYVWQLVLPQGELSVVGQLPSDSYALSAACVGAGTAYSSAAAYAGNGPHPVIVVSNDSNAGSSPQWTPDNMATIQLVACVNRDSNVTDSSVTCSYNEVSGIVNPVVLPGAPTETDVVGLAEYQVTVYALRTHQELGSARVVGKDTTCPQEKPVGTEVFSQLTDAQLHQVLDPYINRSL